MGFDCSAITIIGLRITKKDLQIEKQITLPYKACSHDENTNQFIYCPRCGIKNNVDNQIRTYIDFIKEFKSSFYDDTHQHWAVNGTITINDNIFKVYRPIENEEWLYIGLYLGERDGPRCYNSTDTTQCSFSLEELVEMKNKMKESLSQINLWSDDYFGIYTLINYSY